MSYLQANNSVWDGCSRGSIMKRSVEVLEPPWQHLEAKYRVLSAHLLWHGQRSFGQDIWTFFQIFQTFSFVSISKAWINDLRLTIGYGACSQLLEVRDRTRGQNYWTGDLRTLHPEVHSDGTIHLVWTLLLKCSHSTVGVYVNLKFLNLTLNQVGQIKVLALIETSGASQPVLLL